MNPSKPEPGHSRVSRISRIAAGMLLAAAVAVGASAAPVSDHDGNGRDDVHWQNADGRAAIWLMNGVTPVSTGQILNAGSGWTARRLADFDGNSTADIVWQHTDGRAAVWLMNGLASTASAEILPAGTGFTVAHAADFDGNGRADILWKHDDGRAAVWLMNGTVPSTTNQILNTGSGWTPIHTADLDGDGKADIVWEHADKSVAVWLMNGAAMSSGASVMAAGSGWSVSRTGDFDGNGRADLVWKHDDGRAAVWLMNGTVPSATGQILNAGTGWSAIRTPDLDADGKSDIVWQHTDGSVAAWLMNGTVMSSGAGILGADTGWSVTKTADFDGNGRGDLFWQNADGRAAIWLMNGLVPSGSAQILNAGGGWSAGPPDFGPAPITGNTLRVSVGGFGYVTSNPAGISCGSVAAAASTSSTKCVSASLPAAVALSATPFNANFQFAGWAGDTTCAMDNPCTVDLSTSRWVRAKFTPVTPNSDVCGHLGLVSDKNNRPLNNHYPNLALGASFVDPNFGTTIRRITNVANDGRGSNKALKPVYSTISAWNADESYLILYRTSGASGGHELFDGKTYAFIRKLDDLPWNDLEQVYWDTTRPNIIYGGENNILYRYDVDAPAGQRLTTLRNFTAQCGAKQMHGGADPFFNSWDSKIFGMSCVPDGVMFSYNALTNTLGTLSPESEPRASPYDGVQAAPSGTRLFLNRPQPGGGNAVRLYDLNMAAGAYLDQQSGDEHAGTNMLFNGDDTYNAIQFDVRPGGSTGTGSLVQWNLDAVPDAGTGRILGRVIVGEDTGYPYPPSGTHIGGTSFHRTGLLTVSIKGNYTGATLLDNELLYVDSDLATNGGNFVCRIGHNRTKSEDYWAEPHPSISPSGTRIVFGSSWGDAADPAVVNSYVVELPGYKP